MRIFRSVTSVFFAICLAGSLMFGQTPNDRTRQKVRPVTVPISIFTKQELEKSRTEEFIQADRLVVKEDKEEQTILSIRSVSDSPLQIEVLIDDALSGNINLQLADIAAFIRKLSH